MNSAGNTQKYEKLVVTSHDMYSSREKFNEHKKSNKTCSVGCCSRTLLGFFPVVNWVRHYNLREHFIPDVISALTLTAIVIPQGMAYAMLAFMPPVNGLYLSIVGPIVYSIFGTSKHLCFGTFALLSMTVHTSVQHAASILEGYDDEIITASICLYSGLMQVVFGSLRLGSLIATFLNKTVIRGFSTAIAFHICASQLSSVFNVEAEKSSGDFPLINNLESVFKQAPKFNYLSVLLTVITMTFLLVIKSIEKILKSRYHMTKPLPSELTAVVLATALSYFMNLDSAFNLKTIGEIPSRVTLFTNFVPPGQIIIQDSIIVALLAFVFVYSFGCNFKDPDDNSLDSNQEFIACGFTNAACALVAGFPGTGSLSRTVVQVESGGKTQLAGLLNGLFVLAAFLIAKPLMEFIPKCVLAGVIIVAVRSLFKQFTDLVKLKAKKEYGEMFVWLTAFIGALLLQAQYGLLVGMLGSLGKIFYESNKVKVYSLAFNESLKVFEMSLVINPYNKMLFIAIEGPLNSITAANIERSISDIIFPSKTTLMYDNNNLHSANSFDCIVLDMGRVLSLDYSATSAIKLVLDSLPHKIIISNATYSAYLQLKKHLPNDVVFVASNYDAMYL